ncbi:MAG TPA: peptidase M50, partial [Oribacterium sp.]|nr:peptidase M50 [Oribacterium sp.]
MNILSIIIAIFGLGFLVFFHEFGHFLAAKLCHVGVLEFSIGMGPRLFSR